MMRFFGTMKLLRLTLFSALVLLVAGCTSAVVSNKIAETRLITHAKYGLTDRSVTVDGHTIHYVEGGVNHGESVLLIHGFGADCDNWLYFAGYLVKKYHVVAPDLPGFGQSPPLDGQSYGIASQVRRLHRFAEALGLKTVHMAGNSMGGAIAGIYAAEYPAGVSSLALLAPSGLRNGLAPTFASDLASGRNALLMLSPSDFDRMLDLCFYKKPTVPDFLKNHLVNFSLQRKDFNRKVFDDIIHDDSLEKRLKDIAAPTLVIWGENDGILDAKGADTLTQGIGNARALIIKECGHTPMIEKAGETANGYLEFLKSLKQAP